MTYHLVKRATKIWRKIFNLGNFWILFIAAFIHAYVILFLLPPRESDPDSFRKLKELAGVAGWIDRHPLIFFCMIVIGLALLRRYLPIKSWLRYCHGIIVNSAPVKKIANWFEVDPIRKNLILLWVLGFLLAWLPHAIIVVFGVFTMLGSFLAFSEREYKNRADALRKVLSGEAKVGLWCKDQLMSQTEPGVFEITALIKATLLTSQFAKHRELFIDGIQTVSKIQITEPQERKGSPTSRYLGALIPPSIQQVLGVPIVHDVFRQILDEKIPVPDGLIDIQLKCRLSSDVNLHAHQAHFCLPNQRLEIEECQVLPTLEHRI